MTDFRKFVSWALRNCSELNESLYLKSPQKSDPHTDLNGSVHGLDALHPGFLLQTFHDDGKDGHARHGHYDSRENYLGNAQNGRRLTVHQWRT